MTGEAAAADSLGVRTGVGDEIAAFRARFPRAVWPQHPNLGDTARFWLQRHAMFREFGAVLGDAATGLRDGHSDPAGFRAFPTRAVRVEEVEALMVSGLDPQARRRLGEALDRCIDSFEGAKG